MDTNRTDNLNMNGGSPRDNAPEAPRDPKSLNAPAVDELQLHRYLEGHLSDKERESVDEILRTQPAARRMLDALREEEKLLRDCMDVRVESSARLSDKVIATLHAEERFRLNAMRNRRLRRQIIGVVSMAACLFLIFWLAKPREAAGTAVSGSSATLVTPSGEHRVLAKNVRIYDGDQLSATDGQFIRLRLSNSAVVDIDEHSKLTLEKPNYERNDNAQVLNLESGRIGIDASGRQDVLVQLPQGTVRVLSGARVDIWLPEFGGAKWPEIIEPAPGISTENVSANRDRSAVLTVFSGTALVGNEALPSGASVSGGYRAIFTPQSKVVRKIDLNGSIVLDTRSSAGWHGVDAMAPGLNLVGLLDTPDFIEMGRRFHMTENAPAVAEALKQMQDAIQIAPAAERADKLALGQEALRSAYEPFKSADERRRFGRTLEGIAHLQRGRALLNKTNAWSEHGSEERQSAYVAFKAACVAFEESLDPSFTGELPATDKPKVNIWAHGLSNNGAILTDLSPAEQSSLLACYMHAVALDWQAAVEPKLQPTKHAGEEVALQAAREFADMRVDLGRSVESLSARYAEGLALKRGRQPAKAIDAFREVLSVPLAGCTANARQAADGIKQAAALALVQIHLATGKAEDAQKDADEFWLLYPLENRNTNPAAQEIERALDGNLLKDADAAMKSNQYEAAVELYDELFEKSASATSKTTIPARLQRLKALIALKNGPRARREAAEMAANVPSQHQAEYKALASQAEGLPIPPPSLEEKTAESVVKPSN